MSTIYNESSSSSRKFPRIDFTFIIVRGLYSPLIFSGKISQEELTEVLTRHGRMRVSLEEAGDYIAMVDTDSDGMLDYSEFVTLFTQKIGL